MVNVVQYNMDVYGCGLRDLVPLVGGLSVLVTVVTYMIFIYKDARSYEHKSRKFV
jgi:hypothetical protein